LGTQTALAGIKHLNRLENVLARSEWDGDAYAEGLVCDEGGLAISGTMSNLFIFEDQRLCTPDLGRCGVAGLTRELVLEQAGRDGVPCSVEDLPLERVLSADEVFFVNSLIGVWPVRMLADRTYAPALRAREVSRSLEATDRND
jgi:4-amino-4-deoxychorismate lyase